MPDEGKVIVWVVGLLALLAVAVTAVNVLPFYWYGYCEQVVVVQGRERVITVKCAEE